MGTDAVCIRFRGRNRGHSKTGQKPTASASGFPSALSGQTRHAATLDTEPVASGYSGGLNPLVNESSPVRTFIRGFGVDRLIVAGIPISPTG